MWTSSSATNLGGGVYVGNVATPGTGARAFMIELTFASPIVGVPYKFTTEVRVVSNIPLVAWPYFMPANGPSPSADPAADFNGIAFSLAAPVVDESDASLGAAGNQFDGRCSSGRRRRQSRGSAVRRLAVDRRRSEVTQSSCGERRRNRRLRAGIAGGRQALVVVSLQPAPQRRSDKTPPIVWLMPFRLGLRTAFSRELPWRDDSTAGSEYTGGMRGASCAGTQESEEFG